MNDKKPERSLIISSRLDENYRLTELGNRHLQHLFTDWFPRAVYDDLTDDTARVDVVVRKGNVSNKSVFHTSFLRIDDSVIKTAHYDEEGMVGKRCDQYERNRTHYEGQKDGRDYRHVYYSSPIRRAR